MAFLVALLLASCSGGGDDGAPSAASGPDTSEAAPTEAGSPVPSLSLQLLDGGETSLAAYEGTPTVVNFWASWCPPCVDEMPDLEEVDQQFADVEFLGINTRDELDDARRLAAETGVTYDLAQDPDGELFRAFGVFSMPTTFFVSADGQVLDRHNGSITKQDLVTRIEELFP